MTSLPQTFASRRISSLLLFVMLFVCRQDCIAESPQGETAETFAKNVLNIYKLKDVQKLLALSIDGTPSKRVLRNYAPGTGRYNSLFGDDSWRWKAVQNWNGEIESVRYNRVALIEFANNKESGTMNCVRLQMEGGKWKFQLMSLDDADNLAQIQFNKVTTAEANSAMIDDARTTAVDALKAFQAKDVDAVLAMSVEEGPLELQYLSAEQQQQPKSDILFSTKQMAGVIDWNGKTDAVYISETAKAEFGRSDSEVFVVTMPRVGDEWKFDDVHSPDVKEFEALSPAVYGNDATAVPSPNKPAGVFSDADAGFEAMMHGKPEHNITKTGKGPEDVQHQYLVPDSNGVYMVAYQDHPVLDADDPTVLEELFTSARNGFQKGIMGEQTDYRTITQANFKGRESRFHIPSNQGEATTRMFFVNQRWYHVFVLGTSDFVNSKAAQQFLDSFRVIGRESAKKSPREDVIQKLKDF